MRMKCVSIHKAIIAMFDTQEVLHGSHTVELSTFLNSLIKWTDPKVPYQRKI